MEQITRDFDWAVRHAGGLRPGREIEQLIDAEFSAYFWVVDITPRERFVHCERCQMEWRENRRGRRWDRDYRQGSVIKCPQCGDKVIAKHTSRGFRGIRDRINMIWYQQSEADPEAIVALGARCERDYSWADEERPWTLATQIEVCAVAVLEYGVGCTRFQRHPADWLVDGSLHPTRYRWNKVQKLGNLTFGSDGWPRPFGCAAVFRHLLTDTLDAALIGTPFARAWHPDYLLMERGQDGVIALGMIAKYPCVEHLTKLGMRDLFRARLEGELPGGELNLRGKSMTQVLRLSKQTLGQLRADKRVKLTPLLLMLLHYLEREGLSLPAAMAAKLADRMDFGHFGLGQLREALDLHRANRRARAIKYMLRTRGGHGDRTRDVLDYWHQCRELGANLDADDVAFPADFAEAHQRASERIRVRANKPYDEKIAELVRDYQRRFGFSFGGLTLRPAASSAEVIREGEVLHHCVGGYVCSYAEGRTVICVLRRDVDPDTPWRTVEITTKGQLVQDRGLYNDTHGRGLMTETYRAALDLFWEAWRARKIKPKQRRDAA